MKNVLLTCIMIVLLLGRVIAQQASRPILTDNMQSMQVNALPLSKVHVKAMRDFLKREKKAITPDWMIIETGYVVKYADEAQKSCRTIYNSHGQYMYTIKQYGEAIMPRDVRAMVKSHYYDYTITLVEEVIETMKPTAYIVHMEDSNTLKNIRISDRDMEVMSEYKKSK